MCIQLWRRYFCPKGRYPEPLQQPAVTHNHPKPKPGVSDHHLVLVLQDQNVFSENAHDPTDSVPDDMQIHWVHNIIRCAHPHHEHCQELREEMAKIQYINSACTHCTGNIDVHFEHNSDVLCEWNHHPRIPTAHDSDRELRMRFDKYKGEYILQLLGLICWILQKPLPIPAGEFDDRNVIETCWPELWCKVNPNHIAHPGEDCHCIQSMEAWRVNLATSFRQNEAANVLFGDEVLGDKEVDLRRYRQGIHGPQAILNGPPGFGLPANLDDTIRRVQDFYDKFDLAFPRHQMGFVNLQSNDHSDDTYMDRHYRLLRLSTQCRAQLYQRGEEMSQSHPDSGFRTIGVDLADWNATLGLRECFLNWVYMFLAFDAGLDEELMMFLAGGLLAILNPWPNASFNPHPSHPDPQALNKNQSAHYEIQECVYELERWPLDNDSSVWKKIDAVMLSTANCYNVWIRERSKVIREAAARNRVFDVGAAHTESVAAVQSGQTDCPVCHQPWESQPYDEPVQMWCCKQYVGKHCLKQWLKMKPLDGGWICTLCRGNIDLQFKPPPISGPSAHEPRRAIGGPGFPGWRMEMYVAPRQY